MGCFIRPNDEPCPVRPGDSVGVDWHISVIKVLEEGYLLCALGGGRTRLGVGGGVTIGVFLICLVLGIAELMHAVSRGPPAVKGVATGFEVVSPMLDDENLWLLV